MANKIRRSKNRNEDLSERDFGTAKNIKSKIDKTPSETEIALIEEQELALRKLRREMRLKELAFDSFQRDLAVIEEKENAFYFRNKKELLAEIGELEDQVDPLIADFESDTEASANVVLRSKIQSISAGLRPFGSS